MNLKFRIGGAIASAALMLTVLAPKAFADTTDGYNGSGLEISGNGSGSNNTIIVTSTQSCDVSQKANTYVEALVSASSSTGGNTASNNTGGSTAIDTGNATSTATVDVTGGSNTATDPCCCQSQAPTGSPALISGNGDETTNIITDVSAKISSIKQKAKTRVGATVLAKAKTGKNKAKNNTGPGDVSVDTGTANSTAGVTVTGGTNDLPNP